MPYGNSGRQRVKLADIDTRQRKVVDLCLPIMRMMNGVRIEALKLFRWKQNDSLVAVDLCIEVLLFVVVARSHITCAPVSKTHSHTRIHRLHCQFMQRFHFHLQMLTVWHTYFKVELLQVRQQLQNYQKIAGHFKLFHTPETANSIARSS